MGELFKVQVDFYTGRLAESATLTIGWMHAVFCGLDDEVWKPTISFYIPLERDRAPEPLSPTTTN